MVPNSERKRSGATFIAPVSELGPWDGARVASQHCPILRPGRRNYSTFEKETFPTRFASGCSIRAALGQLKIPPPWANSSRSVDAVGCQPVHGLTQPARCIGWSGPWGEEFAPDKSAPATTRQGLSRTRERYLAKECVGSNRVRKERLQLPVAKQRQPSRSPKARQQTERGKHWTQRPT